MNRADSASHAEVHRSPAVAVVALAILAILVALTTTGLSRPLNVFSPGAQWTLLDEQRRVPVEVPFRASRYDREWDEQIILEHRLIVPMEIEDPGLLLTGIRGSIRVEADGQLITHTGTWPDLEPRAARGSVIVSLPKGTAEASMTTLTVHLSGAHGTSEIWGRPLVGARSDLERELVSRTGERLALVATLAIAATLGLVISAVRPRQQEFLWFGLFCTLASMLTFAHIDTWWLISDHDGFRARLHALAYSLLPGSGLLFVYQVILPWRRSWPSVPLLIGGALGLLAILTPHTHILISLVTLTDISMVICVAVGIGLLRKALLGGNHAAAAILLAIGVLVIASASDRVTRIFDPSAPTWMLPAFLLFLATTTAAMVLGRSDLADRYRELVGTARDAILVVQKDGRIEEANEAARRLFEQPLVGERFKRLMEQTSSGAAGVTATDATGARRSELLLQGQSGRLTTVESLSTELPEGRVLVVIRDITSRRKVEQGMVHAARMETVGIIAGGIAHDFNNTMTALMAHIGLLRTRLTDPKEEERLQRMEAVIRRAAHMTRRLLTLSRGGNKDRRPVQVIEPVHSAVELTRSMLPRSVTIKERFEADLPLVLGSSDDLEQAILNLLVNARDALAAMGGTIRITVVARRSEEGANGVRIEVEDDGPGVPDSIQSSIWEPFFTTKGEGRGTGLGLSVVARVIRDHGGRIELRRVRAEAPDGRYGTRFTITLPPVDRSVRLPPEAVGVPNHAVLVVEDDEEIREFTRTELVMRGYRTTTAASAEEALSTVAVTEEPFDLLVTDVVMGRMDGIKLAEQLVAQQPNLRVVVASGFIPEHINQLDPSWQRLDKPFTAEQLATAVRRALFTDLPTGETEERPSQRS